MKPGGVLRHNVLTALAIMAKKHGSRNTVRRFQKATPVFQSIGGRGRLTTSTVKESERLARDEAVFLHHQSLSTSCLDELRSANQTELTNLQHKTHVDFHDSCLHQFGYGHPSFGHLSDQAIAEGPFILSERNDESTGG